MAVSSWFVSTTKIRDRMLDLNQQIRWVPEHVKDGQFGRWLENTRDWSISRNRFWGSPIPVWRSDDPAYPRVDVYGSLDELERDFGVRPDDLHRPFIDQLTRPNPDDPTGRGRTMRRVTDVMDCWFESGSMSFAQVHYPFENAEWFEHHFPGDFIVEYIGQTRGWFYTMHVLASRALRAAGVRDLRQPRHRARLRRPEDEQVAAQLPRRARGLRPRRGRRDALVPDVQPDPARRQPDRHRAQHPRGRPPGADPAVELLVLLRALRQRRRLHRAAAHRLDRPAGPLPAGQDPPVRRGHDASARRLRDRQRVRLDAGVPRRALQLVHPPVTRALLGRRRQRRRAAPSTRSTRCSRRWPGAPRRCCR